jgi:hypothetical protein
MKAGQNKSKMLDASPGLEEGQDDPSKPINPWTWI